jgi:signal transduction histidine kinase
MNNNKPPTQVSTQDILNVRQSIGMLRTQVQTGRVEGQFFLRQIDKLTEFMERVEAEHGQQKKARRFEALYNVSRLLGTSLDLQTVLDQVMDAIIQLTGAERGFLMLRDDDGGLTVQAARGLDQQALSSDNFRYSRTIANQVLDNGEPVVTTNAVQDPRFAAQASIVSQSLRSIMAAPLRARGGIIGVVYVDNRVHANLFEQEDLDALEALAGQAAIAIENARLFAVTDQALTARVDELTQLRRVDRQLNETLDSDRAMIYTLEWACRLADAKSGHFGLITGEPPVVRAVHHYGVEPGAEPEYLHLLYPEVFEVIRSEKPVYFSAGKEKVLITPVQREHTIFGVVVLKSDNIFTTEQQDLVERVVTRAAVAIENARLYAAVQAADRAKSEFVGIVAHDLKVPMTSILGYAELMLMRGGLGEREMEFLNRVRDTVKRMEMLVSDLADISRIESGHFFMNETRVKVRDVVKAVIDSTITQIEARKHIYLENIQPNLPDMRVDFYRLVQVLTNLVSNAYKYTPEGGKVILEAKLVDNRIQFSIQDTGIGMSKEALAMLGTKFWRSEDDFTRSQPGTGLGFAITRSLVEQMGSNLSIESEIGQGSKFTFSVAIAQD